MDQSEDVPVVEAGEVGDPRVKRLFPRDGPDLLDGRDGERAVALFREVDVPDPAQGAVPRGGVGRGPVAVGEPKPLACIHCSQPIQTVICARSWA